MSEIVDAHVPQVEEEQTADAATHSFKLEADVQWGVAELNTAFGVQSAQHQKMDAMRFDEQKIFATTKEDLRQVTARRSCGVATTSGCDSEGINKQSPDIAGGVNVGRVDVDVGAGDQDITFGHSSGETENVTPLTHSMSTRLEGID